MGLSAAKTTTRMEHLRRALKLKPDFDEARLELARLAIEAHEYASVAAILSPVKDDTALAREARFLEGVALLEGGKYAEAAALFGRLAEQEATPGVLANQGLALLRTGTQAGSKVIHQAVEKAPAWMDLTFNLGWALLVEGDPAGAVFWLRGVTKQSPHDVNARVALSWALRKAGRAEEAAEEWRGVALLGPTYDEMATPDLSQRLGRVMMDEQPLVVDRTDLQLAATHIGRADALLKASDVEGALRELTRASYLDPYSARAHALMARAHTARGDKEKAVNELQMSLWCQEDAAVRLALARLLLDLGRTSQAQAEAQKVLRTDPDNAEARALSKATPPKPEEGG
jgi:Flp pilus assembly protein TadD